MILGKFGMWYLEFVYLKYEILEWWLSEVELGWDLCCDG